MPAYSMGKEKKEPSFIAKKETPGAGAYSSENWKKVSRMKSGGSASMTKAGRFFKEANGSTDNVGPGSYNPEKPALKLSASMKGRHKTNYNNGTPSPADYESQKKFPKKEYSFCRENRKFQVKDGPPPNAYSPKNEKSPKNGVVFGREQRLKTLGSDQKPGPGDYIKQQAQFLSKSTNKYSFQREKKFMTEETFEKMKKNIPGPGSYDIIKFKKRCKGGKFTQGLREYLNTTSVTPGPLAYNPKNVSLKHNPQATIGKSERMRIKTQQIPGPGAYNSTDPAFWKHNYGSAKFPHQNRNTVQTTNNPGPGYYQSKAQKTIAYSITSRKFYQKKQSRPGPQDYNPNYRTIAPHDAETKFGSDERLKNSKVESPGPGKYQIGQKKFGRTHYFNKSRRDQRVQMNQTVGPGSYKLKPFIGEYDGKVKDDKQVLYV